MSDKQVFLEWHQDPMSKDIRKAIIQAVKMHGPIGNEPSKINSVLKRVYGVFKAYQKGVYDDRRHKKMRILRKKLK